MWCVNGNLSILYFRISILTKEYKNYNVQPLDFFSSWPICECLCAKTFVTYVHDFDVYCFDYGYDYEHDLLTHQRTVLL